MTPAALIRFVFRSVPREKLLPVISEQFNISVRQASEAYDAVALEFAETPRPVHDTAAAVSSERLSFLRD